MKKILENLSKLTKYNGIKRERIVLKFEKVIIIIIIIIIIRKRRKRKKKSFK